MAEPIAGDAPPSPSSIAASSSAAAVTRKEKRKALKKQKRKQIRKETATREREEEEKLANDPEEQKKLKLKEEEEAAAAERARIEFEESERRWLEAAEARKKKEEERRKRIEESIAEKNQHTGEDILEDDDEWEYIEEGPAEIIWQGNEIIVKKKKIKVAKRSNNRLPAQEGDERPTSNPFPPQSEAFESYLNDSRASAKELLNKVAQQVPNFGTEQDKAHCPFHLKTGACRFGSRCSRIHFYPDKSCTLLMKNMYNGSGLALEQDEGLEYTDEEAEQAYEEFYEDVHTEFQKFGELVNFKVCKNGSCHLRGNVYVHYKSLDAAVLAYYSINGRFYGGKQITCEFVGVTKWRVALCGEFMKSRLKTSSHGAACNFIHCFRNPGGDYEWADWDKPPPRYWMRKMVALFGYSEDDRLMELEDHEREKDPSGNREHEVRRYHSRRSSRCERKYDNDSSDNDSDLKDNDFGRHSDDSRRTHTKRKEESSKERRLSFEIKEEKQERGYSHQHKRHKSRDRSKKQNMEKTEDEIQSRKKHKSRYSKLIVKEDKSLDLDSDSDCNISELAHGHSSSLAFENSSHRFRLSIDEERYFGSGTEDHLQRNSSMASPEISQHSREQASYDDQRSPHHSRHKSHHSEETNGRNSRLEKQKSKRKIDYSPELAGNSKDVIEGYDQDEAYSRSGHSSGRSSRRHGESTRKRKASHLEV